MAKLNQELVTIVRERVAEMRGWGWSLDDIKGSAAGAVLKHAEARGLIGDDPGKEDLAAIQALVEQCLKAESKE